MIKELSKNIVGFSTKRKLVVFSVDDYGNVRIGSKEAFNKMQASPYKSSSIFDNFDALETYEDLESLYDVLQSVKDINDRPACFTPFALAANIDFEKIKENNYERFYHEDLITTFKKLNEDKTHKLILEGVKSKVYLPEFHGREHVNVVLFDKLLQQKNKSLLFNLELESYSRIQDNEGNKIPYSVAFYNQNQEAIAQQKTIIENGIQLFKKVYEYAPSNFMPPSATASLELNSKLAEAGIKYYDSYRFRHNSKKLFKKEYFYTGKKIDSNKCYLVRNVVFEPSQNRTIDSVGIAMNQIKYAFMMGKPAIISSHRVNFCGRINEDNRKFGLDSLRELLSKIKKEWPEVEFISAAELGNIIMAKTN